MPPFFLDLLGAMLTDGGGGGRGVVAARRARAKCGARGGKALFCPEAPAIERKSISRAAPRPHSERAGSQSGENDALSQGKREYGPFSSHARVLRLTTGTLDERSASHVLGTGIALRAAGSGNARWSSACPRTRARLPPRFASSRARSHPRRNPFARARSPPRRRRWCSRRVRGPRHRRRAAHVQVRAQARTGGGGDARRAVRRRRGEGPRARRSTQRTQARRVKEGAAQSSVREAPRVVGSSPAIAEENIEHRGRPHRPRPRPVDGSLPCNNNARVDSGASRLVDLSPGRARVPERASRSLSRHARCTS